MGSEWASETLERAARAQTCTVVLREEAQRSLEIYERPLSQRLPHMLQRGDQWDVRVWRQRK